MYATKIVNKNTEHNCYMYLSFSIQGLFRKVVLGEITSKEFVRMSAEQLASEELTQWRESTMKKELKMIKEVAEEEVHLSSSQTIRKMTYKGEVEIEQPTTVSIMCVYFRPNFYHGTNRTKFCDFNRQFLIDKFNLFSLVKEISSIIFKPTCTSVK